MKRTFLRRSPQSNFDFTDVFRKEQRATAPSNEQPSAS